MAETIRIEGLRELDRKLAQLPTKLGFKALRQAMMQSTLPMFKAAKAKAEATGIMGYDAGATAAAMSRFVRKEGPHTTVLYLGPKNQHKTALALYNAHHKTNAKRLNHFHLVEFGSVRGPAQPFLRPAFDAQRINAARLFGEKLKLAIEKVSRSA